jgi:hypothetical protein
MDNTATRERSRASAVGSVLRAIFIPKDPRHDDVVVEGDVPQRHQDALAVLDAARMVVQRGWVQRRWYVLQAPGGRRRSFGPTSLTRLDHTQVVQACVVGAVLHAAWQQSSDPEHANPAIDALWQTLRQRGTASEPVGPVSSPPVRAARVRDLTTWNDQRGRTQTDVVQLLDRTVTRISDARRLRGASH